MSFETPEAVAAELKLFTENDGDIYRRQTTSILRNLATKKASGKYDRSKAVDLFMYLAETGAKAYAKEFGGPGAVWHDVFPRDVRRLVATGWRDEFEAEYTNGAYDSMLPKKYQGLLGSKKLLSGPKTTKTKSGNTTRQTTKNTKQTLRQALHLIHSGKSSSLSRAAAYLDGLPIGSWAETEQARRNMIEDLPGTWDREYTASDLISALYDVSGTHYKRASS